MTVVGGLALLATPAGAPEPPAADLRDYALASCLMHQDSSTALKEQGSFLGSIVLERSDGASAA